MPCEHYKDAIIEAAAGGAAPLGELRAHLAECDSCRDALAEEQSLFAAIDSGLHVTVNSEVPTSLVPRVRASIDEAVVANRRWLIPWPALFAALVIVGVLLAVNVLRHTKSGNNARDPITSASSNPRPAQAPSNVVASVRSKPADKSSPPQLSGTKNAVLREALASRSFTSEVLVPRDQELLVASYARQWSAQQRAPLVPEGANQTAVTPLEVAPIQITELDVKLLAGEK